MIRFLARLILAVTLLAPQLAAGLTPAQKVILLGGQTLAGAELLLAGETSGFATDFTEATESRRVLVRNAGADTYYQQDQFYSNGGTSPKYVHDSAGTLVWSPHNMFIRSEDFTQGWTNTQTPVTTAHTIEDNNAAAHEGVRQDITGIVGAQYTATFWILKDSNQTRFPEFELEDTSAVATNYVQVNTQTGATAVRTANGTVSHTISDEGTHWKLSLTITAGGTTVRSTIYPALGTTIGTAVASTVGTVTVDKVQLNRGTVPTAYLATTTAARFGLALDYDPSTLAARGLLVEPAATNLALQSRDFSNASWTKVGLTAAKTATGPDGVANSASTLTATSANSGVAYQNITSASSARVSSVFIKRRTGSGNVYVSAGSLGSDLVTNGGFSADTDWTKITFTISGGVATSSGGGSLSQVLSTLVGRIYKVTWTIANRTVGSVGPRFSGGGSATTLNAIGSNGTWTQYIRSNGNNNFLMDTAGGFAGDIDNVSVTLVQEQAVTVTSNWTRVATTSVTATDPIVYVRVETNGDEVDVDLFQHETGSVATSPISTFAATVTRALDQPSFATASIPYITTAGTWVLRAHPRTGSISYIGIDTTASRLFSTAVTAVRANGYPASVTHTTTDITAGSFKLAHAFDASDTVMTARGDTPTAAGAGGTQAVTTFYVGARQNGTEHINGWISQMTYLPRRATGPELQTKTAP